MNQDLKTLTELKISKKYYYDIYVGALINYFSKNINKKFCKLYIRNGISVIVDGEYYFNYMNVWIPNEP